MTTTTAPATSTLSGVSFGGILRSEWIKLRSLRSTIWCYAIMVVVTIGFGVLFAAAASVMFQGVPEGVVPDDQQSTLVLVATVGISFSQLIAIILGALTITGEYGTGMIRSTFAAVPKRLPALFGKALVFAIVTFVVSFVAIALTALFGQPILAANGIPTNLADATLWLTLAGGAAYVALIGLFGMAIGAIIRNSAGSIAAALAVVLVLPTILQIFAGVTQAAWAVNIMTFLPSNAGTIMYTYPTDEAPFNPYNFDPIVLETWQGGIVVVIWVAVLLVLASVLLKRRDA